MYIHVNALFKELMHEFFFGDDDLKKLRDSKDRYHESMTSLFICIMSTTYTTPGSWSDDKPYIDSGMHLSIYIELVRRNGFSTCTPMACNLLARPL